MPRPAPARPPSRPPARPRAAPAGLLGLALLAGLPGLAACAAGKQPFRSAIAAELFLEVLPRQALLELDGVGVGRGSRSLPAPEPGAHVLVVSAEGFEPEERALPAGSLESARVGVALRPEGFGGSRTLDFDEAGGLAAAAAALGRAGRHRDALDYAARAAALDRRLPLAQRALGDALAALGRLEEARAAWGRYLLLVPDAPDAPEVGRRMGQGRATFDMPAGR